MNPPTRHIKLSPVRPDQNLERPEQRKNMDLYTGIAVVAGAGMTLVAVPVVLGAVGFTGAGIAAGSIAAKMMSAAAVANGGGVVAGSTVAVLQSAGAAGLSGVTSAAVAGMGGAAGALTGLLRGK